MHEEIIERAKECLEELFKKHKIPVSHGFGHASCVMANME